MGADLGVRDDLEALESGRAELREKVPGGERRTRYQVLPRRRLAPEEATGVLPASHLYLHHRSACPVTPPASPTRARSSRPHPAARSSPDAAPISASRMDVASAMCRRSSVRHRSRIRRVGGSYTGFVWARCAAYVSARCGFRTR